MLNAATPGGGALLLDIADLGRLHTALAGAGYRVIGPTVRDGAIILDELRSADDLPFGWGVSIQPGGYRIRRRDDGAAFSHSVGPQSWKQFLQPPMREGVVRAAGGTRVRGRGRRRARRAASVRSPGASCPDFRTYQLRRGMAACSAGPPFHTSGLPSAARAG